MAQITWRYDDQTGVLEVWDHQPRIPKMLGTYNAPKKKDVIKILKDQWNIPIFQRKLAANHASACERAHCEICKCRCGGQLHGHDHKPFQQIEEALFLQKKQQGQFVLKSDIDDAIKQAVAMMKGQP